jgi:hypothetical protein
LPVERILKEERPSARRVRDAFGIQPREQEGQAPCRNCENGDIAKAGTSRAPVEGVDYAYVTNLDEPAEITGQDSALEFPVFINTMFAAITEIEWHDVNGR